MLVVLDTLATLRLVLGVLEVLPKGQQAMFGLQLALELQLELILHGSLMLLSLVH